MDPLLSKGTLKKLGSTFNEGVSSGVSDFARRQLEKYGWKEGKGLGKNEDGIVGHVKIDKKEDNSGVGVAEEEAQRVEATASWWHNAFSSTLTKISVGGGSGKKDKKKKKKKSKTKGGSSVNGEPGASLEASIPSFDDLFKATGGARLGMRARRSQSGKIKRSEQGVSDESIASSSSSSSGPEKKKPKKRKRTSDLGEEEEEAKRRHDENTSEQDNVGGTSEETPALKTKSKGGKDKDANKRAKNLKKRKPEDAAIEGGDKEAEDKPGKKKDKKQKQKKKIKDKKP